MNEFEKCFYASEHLLMEGALGERLKREYGIRFDRHIDMGGLVESGPARDALKALWKGYAETAARYSLPFLATTPTRRTNRERIERSGFSGGVIRSNAAFLSRVRSECAGRMFIGALLGCRGDAYTGENCLNAADSCSFHSWETELFAQAGVDFFMAGLMPDIEETVGLARAAAEHDIPLIISFTLQRNGCLSDGTRLSDAIERVDSAARKKPLCYMTNCVHPRVVMEALAHEFNRTDAVRERFMGIQANTSALSFAELDGSATLHAAEPRALARDMAELSEIQPMKIVGGCCGTDGRHIEEIAKLFGTASEKE